MTWYGRYTENGKRISIGLCDVTGTPPASLSIKDEGDARFEASREKAKAVLVSHRKEASQKGHAVHLTERLVEAKTGRRWVETQLADLPEYTRAMKGRRSEDWQTWQVDVVGKFVEWAQGRGLRSVLEITPEVAESYIEMFSIPDKDTGKMKTTSTLRHIKNIISMVMDRVLPHGVENPFKKIRIQTPEGGEVQHRKPLKAEEVDRLLKQAEMEPLVFPLIVTALSTGLRRGDVCRLKWSEVNLRSGALTVKTSKTGAAVTLPIMDRLRDVLEGALAERKSDSAKYVFPEAERMLRKNPDGITYRVKKVFALAFAPPQEAVESASAAPERVSLADVLPEVLEAVRTAEMADSKRDKLMDLLALYASGLSYRQIEEKRKISRGGISGLLHEAQRLAGVSFLPDTSAKPDSIKKTIRDVTRKPRTVGMRDASKYDFHALRTTFVTLALGGPNPMPVEKIIALTGHRTVETAMKYYFKPQGSDFKKELEAAMPKSLSGRKGTRKALPEAQTDPVAAMAAQLQSFTPEQRAQLAKILKGGK
ncbi:MAG: tyrosine-type recombinase/integrase [Kiritimatiellia bacterium]